MVCVDPLRTCMPNKNWRWNKSSHLFSDIEDLDELHQFAKDIGLKRAWFQNRRYLPHYDLNPNKRKLAVRRGVEEVSFEYIVATMQKAIRKVDRIKLLFMLEEI